MNQISTMERPLAAPSRTLAGRTAVITGSTSGIGLGIARALAGAGANVVSMASAHPPRSRRCARICRASSASSVLASTADMSKPDAIAAMMAMVASSLGDVDILVNNAGIQHVAPLRILPAGEMGRGHRDQPERRLPHHPRS